MRGRTIITDNRKANEICFFSKQRHIWWGAMTKAGQKRYDNRFLLLKNLCLPEKGQKIIEIGAGDGEFTKRLAKLPINITAIDLTPAVVQRGKNYFNKNSIKNILYKISDAEKLLFKKNDLDIVCGVSVLHHLNYQKALEESWRVLKKGGKIFFSEPNIFNPIIYSSLSFSFLRKRMEISPNETALSKYEIRKILKKIGFRKFKVFNYDFLYPKTPDYLIKTVEKVGGVIQQIPLLKEFSGSIIIYAEK